MVDGWLCASLFFCDSHTLHKCFPNKKRKKKRKRKEIIETEIAFLPVVVIIFFSGTQRYSKLDEPRRNVTYLNSSCLTLRLACLASFSFLRALHWPIAWNRVPSDVHANSYPTVLQGEGMVNGTPLPRFSFYPDVQRNKSTLTGKPSACFTWWRILSWLSRRVKS